MEKMAIPVKNIKGTGENARTITGSWLEYWEEETGRKADKCLAFDNDPKQDPNYVYQCESTNGLVGGHVMKVNSSDKRWYILPICSSHNQSEDVYWAREKDLVLATNH